MDISRRSIVTAMTLGLTSAAATRAGDETPMQDSRFEIDDVRRYGLIANTPTAARGNTLALRQLCSPELSPKGFAGRLRFANPGGADIYYFDDIITFRDGISLDLQDCILNFTKSGPDPTAANAGFIYAVRNFSIENGTIDVHYAGAGPGQGNAIAIGSRSAVGIRYFPNHFDKFLTRPQGNILVRNLRITSDNPNAKLVVATGGLQNVSFDNVALDGKGVCDGIYYEYGWETNDARPNQRQTSHARNLRFTNIVANNLKRTSDSAALATNGAYNVVVDGISVNGGYSALSFGTGESLFYRPAKGVDEVGAKRNISVRNLVAQDLTGTAVIFTGANRSTGGYLKALRMDASAQTDLLDCAIEGFAIDSAAGYGIRSSAGRLVASNGRISNCQRGIVTTDECTWFSMTDIAVVDNAGIGIQIGQEVNIYDPPRQKIGEITNCFIAGNSMSAPGANAGIQLSHCRSVLIQGNRFGYEPVHDAREEVTQGSAVSVSGADTFGVRCVSNYVAGIVGKTAYALTIAGTNGRGCCIENSGGLASRQGPWGDGRHQLDVPRFGALIALDCQYSNEFMVVATEGLDFSIGSPSNSSYGQHILVNISNASRGGLGSCTWPSTFKMAAWENPRPGHCKSIEFLYNGVNWLEIRRTPDDIPT